MINNEIIEKLKVELLGKEKFSRAELIEVYRNSIDKEAKDSNLSWIIYDLKKAEAIKHVGRGFYQVAEGNKHFKPTYDVNNSELAKKCKNAIRKKFPQATYTIWETYSLNEFINHQFATNIVFIDSEKNLSDSIFHLLKEEIKVRILYKPKVEELIKYIGEEIIVIEDLISEAPIYKEIIGKPKVEKQLVDLMANKLIKCIISNKDIQDIYENIFLKYNVDEKILFRYARRRNAEKKIKDFITEGTNILLH